MNIPYYCRDQKRLKINPWRKRLVIVCLLVLYTIGISAWMEQ